MNENTPPPTGEEPQAASGSDRFFSWLRGLGIVRGNDRWFAGVAGGIAAKAGIDPLIVRGIFVVLALLGGPGILLYIAGWLLLPDFSGRLHLEDLFRGRASGGVITAVVILGVLLVLPAVLSLVTGVFTGGFLVGWNIFGFFPDWAQITMTVIWWALLVPAGVVLLVIYLSRRRDTGAEHADAAQSHAQAEEPAPAYHSEGAGQRPQAASWAERTREWGEQVGRDAAAWGDRVGRNASDHAKQAGREASERAKQASREASERARHQYEARRLGAAHVVLTLALALFAAGGVALWAVLGGSLGDSPIPGDGTGAVLLAIVAALTVFAISLIIVGIRGKNSGWVGFLSFCGVIALVFTSILPWGTNVQPFGNRSMTISAASDPVGLTVLAGQAEVDFSELDEQHDFTLWVVAGNATVELPTDQPAIVEVFVLAGKINDNETNQRSVSGPFLSRTAGSNLEGADSDEIVRITVRLIAGNVDIDGADANENEVSRVLELAS